MKFIKEHKKLTIILIIALILIIMLFLLLRLLSVDNSKSEYGDRLEGIEDVKISKETSSKLETEMENLEEVKSCKYRLQGRLIYVEFEFNEGVDIKKAKDIAKQVLQYFDDDEKEYYDIQVIVANTNKDAKGYPKMGYKHKTNKSIVW